MMKHNSSQGGYVLILLAILFAALGLVLVLGGSSPVLSHYASMQGYAYSQQALMASNSGITEALYRLKKGMLLPGVATVSLNTGSSTITTVATPTGKKITVSGTQKSYLRNFQMDLAYGEGVSFHYGIQSGQGGFELENSSSVTGNVYSNGTVVGSGNYIYGDVVSAGGSGLISGIHATGTAYAHTINNSTIDKDAYYQSSSGTTVLGTRYPGASDQPNEPMPISDAEIAGWENWAQSTATAVCTSGTYTVDHSTTIGPLKVPCDMVIKGNGIVVEINGPVWIVGNLSTQNGPIIKMSPGLGSNNVAIIADNPSARSSEGIVDIGQSTQFQGSGSSGSYVFTISGNTAGELGIDTDAINIGQSAGALVAYANHGKITLGQSVNVKSVTAYKIELKNTANVRYDSGLASTLFKAGPSGGFDILDWFEY